MPCLPAQLSPLEERDRQVSGTTSHHPEKPKSWHSFLEWCSGGAMLGTPWPRRQAGGQVCGTKPGLLVQVLSGDQIGTRSGQVMCSGRYQDSAQTQGPCGDCGPTLLRLLGVPASSSGRQSQGWAPSPPLTFGVKMTVAQPSPSALPTPCGCGPSCPLQPEAHYTGRT
jgi:hypothetical protein